MFPLSDSLFILLFAILGASFAQGKASNNPKLCPYGDSECIKNLVNSLLEENSEGYSPLNIVNLNPLKIAEMNLNQPTDSPVFVKVKFKDNGIYGLKGAKIIQVKGFGKDLTQPHQVIITSKSVSLIGDYTIQGKVIIIPISGTGKSNLTITDAKLTMDIMGEPLVKNGKTYMHVKKLKLDLDTSRLTFDFKNLYNGDKALGDSTNKFLNENWQDIYSEVRKKLTVSLASVFKKVINNVFENVPYDELFAKE